MTAQTVSSAIAKRDEANRAVATMVQRLRPELARALPAHMNADRVARIALTLIRKDPDGLGQCDPASFAGALLTAAALGLEPGVNDEAYLVAYKRECTLIVGYQGFAKLFWQSPLAKHLDAQAVFEADDFDYAYGLDPFLRHKPAKGDRGSIVAYYAVATLTNGASAFVVLSPEEVRALRGGREGPSGKIPDPQHWMEKKTVLRQLVKLLPKSAELHRALKSDERAGRELHAELVGERQAPVLTAAPPAVADRVDTATGEVHDADVVEDAPAPSQSGDYYNAGAVEDPPGWAS